MAFRENFEVDTITDFSRSICDGVILAGGQSRRMGQDKALLPVAGKPLIMNQVDAMLPHVARLWLVSNRSLVLDLPESVHLLVDALAGSEGPLSGLLSALQSTHADYLWLSSCDSFGFGWQQAEPMLRQLQQENAEIVYWQQDSKAQPLLAVLKVAGLWANLEAYLQAGQRSVLGWYATVNAQAWVSAQPVVANINTPDDYRRLLESIHAD